jgi:uncharacterized protein (DUF362 family)
MDNRLVVLAEEPGLSVYPSPDYEFSPSEAYPEYKGPVSRAPNPVYALLRRLFLESGLDLGNYGAADWNPLGGLIPPGQRVLVKPNLVFHESRTGSSMDSLVTHASLIRAVLDYVLLARPSRVVAADAPIQGCDFERLLQATGLERVASHYSRHGRPVEWMDLRSMTLRQGRRPHALRSIEHYIQFDLKQESLLDPVSLAYDRFRVAMYNPGSMRSSHRPGIHRYLIAREAIDTDVIISLPKLKTHKKAGLTGALKNLVGTSGYKDSLPHHRRGGSARGGDCYRGESWPKNLADHLQDSGSRRDGLIASLADTGAAACVRLAGIFGSDSTFEGSWSGNDTVWRMCLDLNRILVYGRPDGTLSDVPQRTLLSVTDAIIAGEGDGPLNPTAKPLGLLSLGLNPAAVDYVHAYLMGLNWMRIPIVREAFGHFSHPLVDFAPQAVLVRRDGRTLAQPWPGSMVSAFLPPRGWQGQCELGQGVV